MLAKAHYFSSIVKLLLKLKLSTSDRKIQREVSTHMETRQGVLPLNSSHVLRGERLQEMQDSPLRVEEVGLFQIASRMARKRC